MGETGEAGVGDWAEVGKDVDRGDGEGDGIIENDLFVVVVVVIRGVVRERSKKGQVCAGCVNAVVIRVML